MQTKRIYDQYEITSNGKIFSYCCKKRKQLKPRINNWKYLFIIFTINKKQYSKTIHKLVAEAFIPNPYLYTKVNHIDGNKLNNNVDNLKWCTQKQSCTHARDTGLKPSVCKINMKIAEEIRELHTTGKYKQKELSKMFNLTIASISLIINNKIWVK